MLLRVALVRTDVSEECSAFIISNKFRSVLRFLVTANVVPSSPILFTLTMAALRSSETSVLTRATRRNIPEDNIRHSHRCENLKPYNNALVTAVCCILRVHTLSLPGMETFLFSGPLCCREHDNSYSVWSS
jgi:hypothetical protein